MTQWNRVLGAAILLLLLAIVLSGCGAAPVAETWPGLTVAGDTVYAISGTPQMVYMLDAGEGGQKGTFFPPGEHNTLVWWSPVAVGQDLAYVGFAEPQADVYDLYAFDPETGQERWRYAVENVILAAPVYDAGTVYVAASGGEVHAVDAETGEPRPGWPFEIEAPTSRKALWGSPLVADGRVYVPSMGHYLYCLDATTGELIWEYEAGGALAATPVLEDNVLYLGAFDGKLYAVDADTGEAVEGIAFQAGNWIWSRPLMVDGRLYVTALDGKLYALDPASGDVIFAHGTEDNGPLRASPVPAGDLILAASETGLVFAVNGETGSQRWEWSSGTAETSILTTPVVVGDVVYVLQMDGKVYALETETNLQAWAFEPAQEE